MSTSISKLDSMKNGGLSCWGERIISQLEYAVKLSRIKEGKFDNIIDKAVDFLFKNFKEEGVITKEASLETESMLLELSEAAKTLKIICAAHAHIDMNWMWGFAETVAVTLDTFRTMLNLMDEYHDFKFSQSQASVYRIVEEYYPEMLEEIRAKVKEGRWEVTASTWVETDKNMPNGESLSRHILYTKKYLSKLLDVGPDSLNLDFEPDTFGHNLNVPEILSKGGVKYYYHCRGYDKHNIYRWQSPSGSSVIVYREPGWYNDKIEASMALHVPEFCSKYGVGTVLKVYGVGDHGGGPTRRDIERIIEMNSWPIFPEIRFGTFAEYFNMLEKHSDKLPVEKDELNFVFTGCYTTQTRIKMANRIAEAKLKEAEAFSSVSSLFAGGRYRKKSFENAWEKVLFNHFHDILPGSGVIDTREYAMGQFQQIVAAANTETSIAVRNIASKIDTSGVATVEEDIPETISEGAGVGFAIKDFGLPQTERGKGKTRIFHFFNPAAYERSELVEITIWDWPGDKSRIVVHDDKGNSIRYQVMENETIPFFNTSYWGHTYMKLLVDAVIPACGYSTYVLSEAEKEETAVVIDPNPRTEREYRYILENEHIKVEFDAYNASIISMEDKESGREMIDKRREAGIFRLVDEDDARGMTAWVVGRYMNIHDLNKNVKIGKTHIDRSALCQWISYEVEFKSSRLNVTISLDYNSSSLNFAVECDWHELADKGKCIPQLNFYLPLGYKCRAYEYDIPFGTIERRAMDMDVPANSWMAGLPGEDASSAVMLVTNTKYGFRGTDDSLSVTLIRSSYDPDPYPEFGMNKFRFALNVVGIKSNSSLIRHAEAYNHPISFVSGTAHEGILPLTGSFMAVESGNVAVSAIKIPEEEGSDKGMIIRLYETEGSRTQTVLRFAGKVEKAWFADINEKPLDSKKVAIEGKTVNFEVAAYSMVSVRVELEQTQAKEIGMYKA